VAGEGTAAGKGQMKKTLKTAVFDNFVAEYSPILVILLLSG
jgi:hypothetical protein